MRAKVGVVIMEYQALVLEEAKNISVLAGAEDRVNCYKGINAVNGGGKGSVPLLSVKYQAQILAIGELLQTFSFVRSRRFAHQFDPLSIVCETGLEDAK
ncbi:hypothetical protein KTH_55230 [Thermosporothrix hazakensis]|nr:hypothetical protein KTH_55230 [Thermosporothrix hazakensis]